jgi:hypothetical protein
MYILRVLIASTAQWHYCTLTRTCSWTAKARLFAAVSLLIEVGYYLNFEKPPLDPHTTMLRVASHGWDLGPLIRHACAMPPCDGDRDGHPCRRGRLDHFPERGSCPSSSRTARPEAGGFCLDSG